MTDSLPKFEEALEARNHPDWKGEPMYGDFPDEPQKYEALDSENDRENKSPITRPKRSHEYTENVNNIKCDNCTWTDERIIDRKETNKRIGTP